MVSSARRSSQACLQPGEEEIYHGLRFREKMGVKILFREEMLDCRTESSPLIPDLTYEPYPGEGGHPQGHGVHECGTIHDPVSVCPSTHPGYEIAVSIGVGPGQIGGTPGVVL